jgi:hypothetical protein
VSTGWVHPGRDHCEDTALVEGAIRPARAEDLPQVYDIWYEAEAGDEANPPPRLDVPPFFQHELRTGDMYVIPLGLSGLTPA